MFELTVIVLSKFVGLAISTCARDFNVLCLSIVYTFIYLCCSIHMIILQYHKKLILSGL